MAFTCVLSLVHRFCTSRKELAGAVRSVEPDALSAEPGGFDGPANSAERRLADRAELDPAILTFSFCCPDAAGESLDQGVRSTESI